MMKAQTAGVMEEVEAQPKCRLPDRLLSGEPLNADLAKGLLVVTSASDGTASALEASEVLSSNHRARASFELLRHQLLLARLNEVEDGALHIGIIAASYEASSLARLTPFPLLVFPCLFEDRVSDVLACDRRQRHSYWCGLN
jgi:hypothetical protein